MAAHCTGEALLAQHLPVPAADIGGEDEDPEGMIALSMQSSPRKQAAERPAILAEAVGVRLEPLQRPVEVPRSVFIETPRVDAQFMPGPGTLTFLGTGTSEGIPRVSCLTRPDAQEACPVCWSARHVPGSRNRRRNTGAVLQFQRLNARPWAVAIDCGKMWWESAIEAFPVCGLRRLDAVMLTHWHADAMNGLDDLRDFTMNIQDDDGYDGLKVFCNAPTLEHVEQVFPFLVRSMDEVRADKAGGGGVAELTFATFRNERTFQPVAGVNVTPFGVEHGGCPDFSAFRVGSLAYISDVSAIPERSRRFLRGARHVVLDGLRPMDKHPSHFCIMDALEEVRSGFYVDLVPEVVWLVGMNHEVDHDATNAWLQQEELPCPVLCAYDGLQVQFDAYDHNIEILPSY